MIESCDTCGLLDKSRKKWDEKHYCYLYGCNRTKDGYVCGWCVHDRKDSELKHQGCSYYQPLQPKQAVAKIPSEQLSIFDLFKEISI